MHISAGGDLREREVAAGGVAGCNSARLAARRIVRQISQRITVRRGGCSQITVSVRSQITGWTAL